MNNKTLIRVNQRGKIQYIDYLKGFSILTIILMHLLQGYIKTLPSTILTASSIGGTGVHVFFLCSGIGLYYSYLKHEISFKQFIRKRFLKIYVPYIIIIFISFLLPWMYEGNDRVTALLSHVFLFKMFIPKYEMSFGTQLWFISTIIQLYLLFIPMCLFKNRLKNTRIFLEIFLAISMFWWIFTFIFDLSSIRIWNSFCLQYVWEFALGMCVAERLAKGKIIEMNNMILAMVAIVGIGLQTIMVMWAGPLKAFNDIPALFGYLALALLMGNISPIRWIGTHISTFSYELYLLHIMVISTVYYIFQPKTIYVQVAIGLLALVISIFMGWIYSLFVKKLLRVRR